jgi:hypothetical protein
LAPEVIKFLVVRRLLGLPGSLVEAGWRGAYVVSPFLAHASLESQSTAAGIAACGVVLDEIEVRPRL